MAPVVAVCASNSVSTSSRVEDVAGELAEELGQVEAGDVGRDLDEVLLSDLGSRLVHDLLQPLLVASLVRA